MSKPSYQILRERILEDFLANHGLKVGDKLPTERELEKRYRVSRPTVSKAIAALAAEGWVTKRQGSGIYVAAVAKPPAAPSDRQQPRIGYVTMSLRPVLGHRVFEGIERIATAHGYAVEVASTNWQCEVERQKIATMREQGVQGVVLYPGGRAVGAEEYLGREFTDYPIVVVDMYQSAMRRPHLLFDNFEAGRDMTRYLLSAGHREIAFLKYSDRLAYRSVDDRLLGYRRALEEAGIPWAAQRVIAFEGTGPLGREHCAALERVLALRPRPTALITPYDPYAHASITWLRQRGVAVPGDMVVVGFDNLQDEPWGERFPTTKPDFVRMGERAAELLLERIRTRNFEPTEIVLPCPLAVPHPAMAEAVGVRTDYSPTPGS